MISPCASHVTDFHSPVHLISNLSGTRLRSKYSKTNCRSKYLERELLPIASVRSDRLNGKDRVQRASGRKLDHTCVIAKRAALISKRPQTTNVGFVRRVRMSGKNLTSDVPVFYRRKR